jgi:hypothetical protein
VRLPCAGRAVPAASGPSGVTVLSARRYQRSPAARSSGQAPHRATGCGPSRKCARACLAAGPPTPAGNADLADLSWHG